MTRVRAVSLLTGWGRGTAALPEDAATAAGGRRVIAMPRPVLDGERFRRATRECLIGVAAVDAMLADAGLARDAIRGAGTALIYVTAAAYGAANRAFAGAGAASPAGVEGGLSQERRGSAGTLHFPYTAPSAVPAEVAIEYGLRGGYVILVGGATAAIDALWQAALLLGARRCERALVLAVETFAECEALWARGRWAARGPLVEGAACALLDGAGDVGYAAADAPGALETLAARRAGETLACGPLIGLALAREAGEREARLTGQWRGRRATVTLALAAGRPAYA
jgi:3-oxoacyl-[acyl-carrier-protein] synthase II